MRTNLIASSIAVVTLLIMCAGARAQPELVYSTYLGGDVGTAVERADAVAIDGDGNLFVLGLTTSDSMTTLASSAPATCPSVTASVIGPNRALDDLFVARFNPAGCPEFLTIIGGAKNDNGAAIAIAPGGAMFVIGRTTSTMDFPVTGGVPCSADCPAASFVLKLSGDGQSLLWTTFLVGTASAHDIAVDAAGNPVVIGDTSSTMLPTSPNALQSNYAGGVDAYYAKLDGATGAVTFASYLGGSGFDQGRAVKIDTADNIYLLGHTASSNLPVTPEAFQEAKAPGGGFRAFVTKLVPSSTDYAYSYSTYVGAENATTYVGGLAVDGAGIAYVTAGQQVSDFPYRTVEQPGPQIVCGGTEPNKFDALVFKLSADGKTILDMTCFGGLSWDDADDISLDGDGNVYISGWTTSTDFPLVDPVDGELTSIPLSGNVSCGVAVINTEFQGIGTHCSDRFVSKLSNDLQSLLFSSYLGGAKGESTVGLPNNRLLLEVDVNGSIYLAGVSYSADFPTSANAFQSALGGYSDAFAARIGAPVVANAGADFSVNEGEGSVMLDGSASSGSGTLTYDWQQQGGTTVALSDATAEQPTFDAPLVSIGGETLTFELKVTTNGQGPGDTDTVDITVVNVNHPPVADAGDDQSIAEGSPVTLQGEDSFDIDNDTFSYAWIQIGGTPTVTLAGASTANPTFTAPFAGSGGAPGIVATLVFELTVDDGFAQDAPAPGYALNDVFDSVTVEITNVNNDPVAAAGADQTADENSSVALGGGSSTDPDSDPLSYEWSQTGGTSVTLTGELTANASFTTPFVSPGGEDLMFKVTVNDGYGGMATDEVVVHVQNANDPPLVSAAAPTISVLWPPNHTLVAVGIAGVSDPDSNATITIDGVTQDEPTNGQGDGDTAVDAVINGDGTVLLRAERSGSGDGRVYHVHFTAADLEGSASGVVTVSVPHKKKGTAVDGGELYDSTQ